MTISDVRLPDREARILFFLMITILLNACQPSAKQQAADQAMPLAFFDLKGYFQKEIQRLNQEKPAVTKTVAVNGKSEEKRLQTLDFKEELGVFIQSDINRPDWTDKYRIDSTLQDGQLAALRYQALEDKLRTRKIDIHFFNGKVSEIHIINGGNNIVAGSEQELTYRPRQGYNIRSRQYASLSKDKELSIEVRFGTNSFLER